MFQAFVILLVNLVLCICATEDAAPAARGGIVQVNPDNVGLCGRKPLPNPSNPFVKWSSATIGSEWWPYVLKANRNSSWCNSRYNNCQQPWCPRDVTFDKLASGASYADRRRLHYYWQPSCPYRASWLGSFTWKIPLTNNMYETCYVLWPCCQRIRIVRCSTPLCNTRTYCQTFTSLKNSVCVETSYRIYKNVLVFCPKTQWKTGERWYPGNCRTFPQRCLKRVTISVPQCCECWSCRGYHYYY